MDFYFCRTYVILKKRNYNDTEKTINDIKKIASKLNLKFELWEKNMIKIIILKVLIL